MKDITLKIIGKQSYDDMEEEQMEFVTDGRFYVRGGSAYIIYDESEVSGLAGCKTTIRVDDRSVKMKRIGEAGFGAELYLKRESAFRAYTKRLTGLWA